MSGVWSEAVKEERGEGPEGGSGGEGKATGREQPKAVMEPHEGQEEPGRGMPQHWEAQWQAFLQTLQAPHSEWGSSQTSEATPWGDAKAFLASFEQVAAACGWPRGEWVARLLPALSGGAQQAFSLLAAPERKDYGQVKVALLRGQALRREKQRQHFRQFCCPQLGDPRRMYSQVQELCCQWLKPERHSKEQILELLVLEQFLAGLPGDVQSRIRARGPDSGAQAVALLEALLLSRREAHTGTWQEPLQEWALDPLVVKEEALEMVQEEISKEPEDKLRDIQQRFNGEVTVPGTGIAHPTLLLSPEGQDVAEVELSRTIGVQTEQEPLQEWALGPLIVKEEALEMVQEEISKEPEETLRDTQQMFSGEVAVPGTGIAHPTLLLSPEGQDVAEVELSRTFGVQAEQVMNPSKADSPLHVVEQTPMQRSQRTIFWDILQEDCENMDSAGHGQETLFKLKDSPTGGKQPLERTGTGRRRIQERMPVTSEMTEERCAANRGQRMEPLTGCKESEELTGGVVASYDNPSPVVSKGKKASLSKYATRRHPMSGLGSQHNGEKCNEGPSLEEKIQPETDLDEHHRSHVEERNCGDLELRERLHSKSLATQQILHPGIKTYKYRSCGKSFSQRSRLLRHQKVHTGEKLHQCPECGKNFSQRFNLLRHQITHTGVKPHKCLDCGKSFSQRSYFLNHQKLHMGQNPYQCPDCGKGFCQRSDLVKHQKTHPERNVMGFLRVGKA